MKNRYKQFGAVTGRVNTVRGLKGLPYINFLHDTITQISRAIQIRFQSLWRYQDPQLQGIGNFWDL